MSSSPIPRRAALSAMLVAAGLGAACSSPAVRAPIDLETTVAHESGSEVRIETVNGAIELVIDPARSDVHIRMRGRVAAATQEQAQRRAEGAAIDASRDADGHLVVRPALAEPRHDHDETSLIVTLPTAAGATLTTTNGTITAAQIDGAVEARTTNGRIRLSDVGGAVLAVTTNGTIEATVVADRAELRTTNGNVVVRDVGGLVTARTTNGAVTLDDVGGPVEVTTTNGSARISLRAGFLGVLDVGARNGRVSVSRGDETLASLHGGETAVTIEPGGETSRIRAANGDVTVTIAAGGAE